MKNKSIYKRFFVLACVALAAVACDQWADDIRLKDGKLNKTVVELLQENPDVSIFVSILQKTGYDLLLQNEQSVTVFAPQNSVLQGMD
ncbi:MAG: fasciclin domain-containing protein, partial [Bacteroidales bacterium]|nr:fasciclin domain-containing protein [Bacteroidales bacterium]